ncbi:MAG: hypothetical protein WDN06_04805 [Asticcacaulis sp.]
MGGILLAATGLTTLAFSFSRDWLRRNAPAGTIFTSELSRRRLQVLLDPGAVAAAVAARQRPIDRRQPGRTPVVRCVLRPAGGRARKALLGDGVEAAGLATLGSQIKWKGQTFAVHLAETQEDERMSHLAVLTGHFGRCACRRGQRPAGFAQGPEPRTDERADAGCIDEQKRARPAGG